MSKTKKTDKTTTDFFEAVKTKVTTTHTTGILLVALGHANYTKMACMLAASFKGNNCQLPITLATDVNQIPNGYEQYFTDVKIVDKHMIELDGNSCFIKAKCHINELTPYDNTLFLDVDIILINNGMINTILDELKDVDFAVKNSGFTPFGNVKDPNAQQWANILEVKEAYGFDNEKIWNVHSEFIWWKKTADNDKLFATWIDNFENLKVTPTAFAGCVPDELPLWIAMCQTGIEPHKEHWRPTFWPMDSDGFKNISQLRTNYCGISLGGININNVQKNNYDILGSIYQRMLGFPYVFKAQPKKKWLSERKLH